MIRPTEAVVDLGAVAANYRAAAALGGRPAIGVVKADAYCHGAVPVAKALLAAGAPMLAVALVEEGIHLREAGLAAPILVVGGAYGDRFDLIARHHLTPFVFRKDHLEYCAAAVHAGGKIAAHVKIDTG